MQIKSKVTTSDLESKKMQHKKKFHMKHYAPITFKLKLRSWLRKCMQIWLFVNKIEQLKVQSEKNEDSFISHRLTKHKKTFVVSFFKIENDNLLRAKTKKRKETLIKSLKNVEWKHNKSCRLCYSFPIVFSSLLHVLLFLNAFFQKTLRKPNKQK